MRRAAAFLAFVPIFAHSQEIVLTCTSPLASYDFSSQYKPFENDCLQSRMLCDMYNQWKRLATENENRCSARNLGYAFRKTFVFDKRSLAAKNGGLAEGRNHACWDADESSNDFKIVGTRSLITMTRPKESTFNIDRETLAAGYGAERNFKCSFEERPLKRQL